MQFRNVFGDVLTVRAAVAIGPRRIPADGILTVKDEYAEGFRNQPKRWQEVTDEVKVTVTGGVGARSGLPKPVQVVEVPVEADEADSENKSEETE